MTDEARTRGGGHRGLEAEGAYSWTNVPDVPWGKIAAVAGALLAIRLIITGVSALVSMASHEAGYRLRSGHLPGRR